MISNAEIAEKLSDTIRPFIKGPLRFGKPEFRRGLSGDEIEGVLNVLYEIILEIRTQQKNAS